MPLWVSVFLVLVYLAFKRRARLDSMTTVLNAGAFALLLMPLGSLVVNVDGTRADGIGFVSQNLAEPASERALPHEDRLPDIYFLVFDRYASSPILRDVYGYDNGEFLRGLEESGFFVFANGRANYAKTAHSLAASLNLRHLTGLSEQIGEGSDDWKPLYRILQEHEVGRFLKRLGYRYLHLGSWWGPTMRSPLADRNIERSSASGTEIRLNEFEWLLVEPMLPTRFLVRAFNLPYENRRKHYLRVRQKFRTLGEIPRKDTPFFVFAHFLLPHDPYVFFPDGRYKSKAEEDSRTEQENYIAQLTFANGEIENLVETLLERDPQPIIVIQADEGPFPERYRANEFDFDWRQATAQEIREKFGILNAIYFPERGYDDLYDSMTPVNTFRVIFNRYFGQTLPLLPDRSYAHVSDRDLYSFLDVTDVLSERR
jgi:hypothetical protein